MNVTTDTIEAALLHRKSDRIVVAHRFTRSRAMTAHLAGAGNLVAALPGLKTSEDADYTLQVGDGANGSTDFLPTEISEIGSKKSGTSLAQEIAKNARTHPFASQLKEILQECKTLGYGRIELAFCTSPPDVSYVELKLATTPQRSKSRNKKKGADSGLSESSSDETGSLAIETSVPLSQTDRKRLLQMLPEHHPGVIQEEIVAFVPLVSPADYRRVLAIVSEPTEPVASTVKLLREQALGLVPTPTLQNSEASTYASLFAQKAKSDPSERSALVRVGSEDTLVLFFEGTALSHVDRLRSLSVFDLPETVCSRVILQQDENKIRDLDSVYLVDGRQSDKLLNAFRSYFPDAAVAPLTSLLADDELDLLETPDEQSRSAHVSAISVGLAALEQWPQAFDVNLLSKDLKKKQRRRYGATWHTVAAGVLLVCVSLIAFGRFSVAQKQISSEREEFRLNPPTLPSENPDLLQVRVDSLANAYATYTRALNVLDSLLVGSDQWVQMLSKVTRTVSSSGRTWLTKWTPESGMLRLNGSSLSRLSIVELSRRLDAAIEQVTYEDIGNQRVYSFEMLTVIPSELPQAALYLRGEIPDDFEESSLVLHASPPIGSTPHTH